jgi:hypothetical protein
VSDLMTSDGSLRSSQKPALIGFQTKRIEITSFIPFMDSDSDCSNDLFNFLDFTCDDQSSQHWSPAAAVTTPSPVASPTFPILSNQGIVFLESSGQQQEQQDLQEVQSKPGMTSPRASRVRFSPEAQREMKTWIIEHLQDSRLTREEENHFMTKYRATRKQIRTAFNNRRQRIVNPLQLMYQQQRQQMLLQQLIAAGAQTYVQYWTQLPQPHGH